MSSIYRKRRRDAEDRERESDTGPIFLFGECNVGNSFNWPQGTISTELVQESIASGREIAQARPCLQNEVVDAHPSVSPQRALLSVQELASGRVYTERLKPIGGWRAPAVLRTACSSVVSDTLNSLSVSMEGFECPPPCVQFSEMRLPSQFEGFLTKRNILSPSPIQSCGLPALLSGRDLVGIASTGSGKTLCFCLPLVLYALHQNMHLPLEGGEGPFGLVLCPSRELAKQTASLINELFNAANIRGEMGRTLKCLVAIGGEALAEQGRSAKEDGCHICVATPGRICDLLSRGSLDLSTCRHLVLDEADRMLDVDGFEEEVRTVLSYFGGQRQTALFSATMPRRVQRFARTALVEPITVHVGRAGSANVNVAQEVEFIANDELRLKRALDCLQKTAPPVVLFCDRKEDVDLIHEYFLLKGVDTCAIHGGMAQEDRSASINAFRMKEKDVLIATDVASKGLDFPGVLHVINFQMPKEIENYVHRIGRTGRAGKEGVATTFIDPSLGKQAVLLDLKQLLIESEQPLPQGLSEFDGISDVNGRGNRDNTSSRNLRPNAECEYCGGLGHSTDVCPKLEKVRIGRISRMEGPATRRDERDKDY